MSDYHIKEVGAKKDSASVVFHFAIPDTTNYAGENLRGVLVKHLLDRKAGEPITSQAPDITSGELGDIQGGSVYEYVESVEFSAKLTDVQKRNIIDSRWSVLNGVIPGRVEDELNFYGYDRDVP